MDVLRRLVPLCLLAGAACATAAPPVSPPAPDLGALEAQRARHAGNPGALLAVGTGFYQAGAYERARDVLLAVLALEPRNFRAALELGRSYEALRGYDEALASYQRAAGLAGSAANRRSVELRLESLTRLRLAAEARQAIAAEQSLAAAPPVPNSIAVLPWTYLGADPELKPLERGMAHLVVTDLAKVSRLRLLERERVQAMADELALGTTGRLDSATAARSGRLLRAADVVQGTIRETGDHDLRLDANVVSATTAEIRATGTAADRLQHLFTMEKSLVLDLLGRLGIALSPAEQRAISERPTADLQAFLAFSRGLEAEDRGEFHQAAQLFQQASLRDPGFRAARERSVRSSRMGQSVAVRAGSGMSAARRAQLTAALQGIAPTLAGRLASKPAKTAALRARLAEALRQDDPSRLGTIDKIVGIIPRP